MVSRTPSILHQATPRLAIPAAPFDYESAVEACARGESAALHALYQREAAWLLGVALRIVRNRDSARDVLQDAFVQIWQRAATYQRTLGSARGWIYTVVRHRALDEARRAGRETPAGDALEALVDATANHYAIASAQASAASLEACLQTLDERRRDCIIYAFVDGYTHEEIAATLASPVGTVKSWIRRGLLALKECLS